MPLIAEQELQQVGLAGSQFEISVSAACGSSVDLEHEVSVCKCLDRLPATPLQRPNAGQQLLRRERLDEVVVSTCIQSLDTIGDGVARGEQQDWQRKTPRAQSPADGEPVEARHRDVQDDQIRDGAFDGRQRLAAVRGACDVVALGAERPLEHPANRRVVVDDEDGSAGHASTVASASRFS